MWLVAAFLINLLVTITILTLLVVRGDTIASASRATAPGQIERLLGPGWVDSWWPMLKAYHHKVENPKSNLYTIFFDDNVKFQYPPTSLLFFPLLSSSMTKLPDSSWPDIPWPLKQVLTLLSQIAVLVTVFASAVIMKLGYERLTPSQSLPTARAITLLALSLVLGITYYPLLHGYSLGQIQVFLNAFIAIALLFYLLGWQAFAGTCFGICCLVKPQYGVLLLWSLLRQEHKFTLGFIVIVLVGLVASLAHFGLQDHLRYLDVLQMISQHGESLYLNQSFNGLLNRLLMNGNSLPVLGSHQSDFAPYHPFVHAVTIVTSVGILALALQPWSGGRRIDGGPIDLMVVLTAATMA